jgi:hypothetical protein
MLTVQGSPMKVEVEPTAPSPASSGGTAQIFSPTPETGWHVAPVKPLQSASVVQPGVH